MFEISVVVGLFVWLLLSGSVAILISRVVRLRYLRIAFFLVLFPALSIIPLVDELLGKRTFDRLCDESQSIEILDSIKVGDDFYTPDGRWRGQSPMGPLLPLAESNRLEQAYKAAIREDVKHLVLSDSGMPIYGNEHRLYSRLEARLLASYRTVSTPGGWISRRLDRPIFVRAACWPDGIGEPLKQKLLTYRGTEKAAK